MDQFLTFQKLFRNDNISDHLIEELYYYIKDDKEILNMFLTGFKKMGNYDYR